MPKRATVSAVALDPKHKVPVILLQIDGEDRFIPIWIGLLEASAILVAMEGTEVQRPMTHDLLTTVARVCGLNVTRVEVSDIRDGTYFAELTVQQGDRVHVIDCRPSDAIALALRTSAPIWVHERVLDEVRIEEAPGGRAGAGERPAGEVAPGDEPPGAPDVGGPERDGEGESSPPTPTMIDAIEADEGAMRDLLERLSPDDFKYKM